MYSASEARSRAILADRDVYHAMSKCTTAIMGASGVGQFSCHVFVPQEISSKVIGLLANEYKVWREGCTSEESGIRISWLSGKGKC